VQSLPRAPVHAPPATVDVIAPRQGRVSPAEAVRDGARLPPLGRTKFDPRLERRAVSKRSVAALLLLATAATALIIGALRTLGPHVRFAATPAVFRRAAVDPGRRTDRLALMRPQLSGGISRSRIEQLDDNGRGTTPFTHLVAHLTGYAAPGAAEVPTAAAPVPREILQGFSQPAAAPDNVASAFAAPDSETAAFASLPGEMLNSSVIVKAAPVDTAAPRIIMARAGDTLPRILQILGTAAADVDAISGLLSPHRWLRSNAFAGGEKITVLAGSDAPQGPVHPLKVSIERPGGVKAAVARADSGGFVPVVWSRDDEVHAADAPSDSRLRPASDVSLRDGLYGMAAAQGVDRTLIDEIVRLSGHDVDLDAFVSASDTVEILFRTEDGGEPELAFTALTLDGHPHRYYRFTAPDDNSTDFYDADGRSVTQSLLRKPVAAGRLGDGYGWRMHPVLGVRRMHEGVDYTAPFGSPIVAAASGMVELISEQPGYGKYVRLRHDQGYETTYAHLSNVPRGLHVGERVRQGQTIAFVGSTGYSTGSHLYYEVRINGRNVDPLRVKLRGGRVLDGSVLAAFEAKRDRSDLLLQATASADNE
jgi:murein DD-endopeptidase MepM/ murein hydrolase activator NlpD